MKCDVKAVATGEHCPNTAIKAVPLPNDEMLWLCDRCLTNVKAGAYGENLKKAALDAAKVE